MNPAPSSEDAVFAAALARPAAERAAYLDQACGGDAGLRTRIEARLRAHDTEEERRAQANAVTRPAFGPGKKDVSDAVTRPLFRAEETIGDAVGRYKLVEKLGEGGCGTVYLAEQEEPVRRHVALKVIKLGMDTKEVIARFEAERQVLAMMEHPNIAKVFDAGTTERGRPYFVMELVRGVPITKFCDEKKISTAARLELFTQVCHAVQHAHQKGIIHRDIKPSNILVALHDEVPVPKVIDFGIAKATASGLTEQTVFTALGQFIGTPAYMSPEQAQLSVLDVDTRSDIYSLGVLLYELLTGRTPFDAKELMQIGLDEMRRHICEVEPPRPSARLSTLQGEALNTTAQCRQIAPPKLAPLIRGDLDWIVMRCLEKDRARRYESANGLAHDIQRHLAHEPVSASPPGAGYRFQKFVRRNRLAVAAASAVAFALVLGIVVSSWQAVRANRAEHMARSEAAIAKAVNEFLVTDLLRQADSRAQADAKTKPNPDLKVREALDRAAEKVGTRFDLQPLTEAAVRDAIGSAYGGVGDAAKAALHHDRALQLRKRMLGPENPETLSSMNQLAMAYRAQGKFAESAALHAQTLEIQRRVLGPDHPDTLNSTGNLAYVYLNQGKTRESAALHAQALEVHQRVLGLEHKDTLTVMNNLALAHYAQGKFAESAALHAQTLEIQKRILGPEHPFTITSLDNLARAYRAQGMFVDAVAFFSQALEFRKRGLGTEHPETLVSMNNLAGAYRSQGRIAEAAALHAQTWEIQKRILGAEHPQTLISMNNLGLAYHAQGHFSDAATLHAEAWTTRTRVLGPEHSDTVMSMSNLAFAYYYQGKIDEAVTLQARTLEIDKRVLGVEHPDTLNSMNNLAYSLRAQGKIDEAVALHTQTWEIQQRVIGAEHPATLATMNNLALAYAAQSKHPESMALLTQTSELRKRVLGAEHPGTLASMTELGRILLQQQKFTESKPVLFDVLVIRDKKLPDDWQTFDIRSLLGGALAGEKNHVEAESLLLSGYEGMKQREARMAATDKVRLRDALERLVQFYTAQAQLEKAAAWKEKLDAFGAANPAPPNAVRNP